MRARPLIVRPLVTRGTIDRRPLLEQRQLPGRAAAHAPRNPLLQLSYEARRWTVRIPSQGFEKSGRNRRTLLRDALKRLR